MLFRLIIFQILLVCFGSFSWGKSILWWNTAGAWHIGQSKFDAGINAKKMNQSLKSFSLSQADIMIFGEFHQPAIEDDTFKLLKKNFPFFKYIPVSSLNSDIGYGIFSKTQFETEIKNDALSWGDFNSKLNWEKRSENVNWDFTRSLVICKFHDFQIIPVHLAQPWTYLNKISGVKEIIWGNDHPVAYQLSSLNHYQTNLPTLLIGDFNLPRKFFGQTPVAWNNLSRWTTVKFPADAHSFPASHTHLGMPKMLLDQAYTQNIHFNVKAETLTSEGSDHWPIFIHTD